MMIKDVPAEIPKAQLKKGKFCEQTLRIAESFVKSSYLLLF